jgi:hypothetical protein
MAHVNSNVWHFTYQFLQPINQMMKLNKHKPLALLLLFIAFRAFAGDTGNYDLSTTDKHPIPTAVIFKLWHEVALKYCDNAWKNHNISPEHCRKIVAMRGVDCENMMKQSLPEIVSTKLFSKQIGRKYLWCSLPYTFCNGVEARTDQEVRARCK